jgi:hypothetical protein
VKSRVDTTIPSALVPYIELMTQVTFQRIDFLQNHFKEEVLTTFTAASAVGVSYLKVSYLARVYPKHDCLRPKDLQYFVDTFYSGKIDLLQFFSFAVPLQLSKSARPGSTLL